MKHHFKENETYLHNHSKELLAEWLRYYFLRVDIESKFFMEGQIMFVPDISCYDEDGVSTFFEVVYKNDVSQKKYDKIKYYCETHLINPTMYTISVNSIIKQVQPLNYIDIINHTIKEYKFNNYTTFKSFFRN